MRRIKSFLEVELFFIGYYMRLIQDRTQSGRTYQQYFDLRVFWYIGDLQVWSQEKPEPRECCVHSREDDSWLMNIVHCQLDFQKSVLFRADRLIPTIANVVTRLEPSRHIEKMNSCSVYGQDITLGPSSGFSFSSKEVFMAKRNLHVNKSTGFKELNKVQKYSK